MTIKRDPIERFWEKVEMKGSDECWLWKGSTRKSVILGNGSSILPYGQFKVDGKQWAAHRFSWAIVHGEIPAGIKILHKCDNPSCVNPNHLWTGTQEDNVRDAANKGRLFLVGGHNKGVYKNECSNGHDRWKDNGIRRICLDCQKEASARYRASKVRLV